MSAVKSNLDMFPDTPAFDQGESFGRHAARQELLPLLRGLRQLLPRPQWGDAEPEAALWHWLNRVIADIECPPVTPKPTTPTDDESIPF